ncbi:MAG: hypothetical protein ACXWGA_14395, partial [Actinomycetota bacterium]
MRSLRCALAVLLVGGMLAWTPVAQADTPCGWADVTGPGSSSSSVPLAVDAVSATEAWIVGLRGTATKWRAHSWRWDGSTWSSEPVPALSSRYRSL